MSTVTFGRLMALPGRRLWWILLATLLATLTSLCGVGLMATSSYLISRAALVDTTAVLATAIVAVRAFALGRVVLRYVERYTGHLATFRILTAVRVRTFARLVPLAPARLADRRKGDLLGALVRDVETVSETGLRVVVPTAAAVSSAAVAAVVLSRFSTAPAAVLLVGALVAVTVPFLGRRLGRSAARESTEAHAALRAAAVEGIAGLDELVAWGREDLLDDEVAARTAAADGAGRRLAGLAGATGAVGALLGGGCVLVMLVLAIPAVREGSLDGVYLAMVPLTALAVFEAVSASAASAEHLERSVAAGNRLFAITDREPAVPEHRRAGRGSTDLRDTAADLRLGDLHFGYPGGPEVLGGLSAAVPAGSTVLVTGASGAGKSTLVALLQRFWEYERGSITLGGRELRELPDARARFSVVSQHDHLFDSTVRDNLMLADADADDAELWSALDAAGAGAFVRGLPGGLSGRVGEDGARLSGGERQRLLLARALLARRPVLVLDEATAHLDAPTARAVIDAARRWQGEGSLIVVTHQPELVTEPDLTIHLDPRRPGGAVVERACEA